MRLDLVQTLCVSFPGQGYLALCAARLSGPCARMAVSDLVRDLVRTLCVLVRDLVRNTALAQGS